MIIVLISILCGLTVGAALGFSGAAYWPWCILWGVLAAVAAQLVSGRIIKKRLEADMRGVQDILMNGQKKLKQKIAQWQLKPPGSIKQAQMELERDQNAFLVKALDEVRKIEKWEKWSPLLSKQTATMKLQLYWQMKNFKEVDALIPRAIFMDPMSLAIRLARQAMLDTPTADIRKTFNASVRRLRNNQGALLYGLFSWLLVQRNEVDEAFKVLIQAVDKIENETLKRNKGFLANNQVKQFSNAGFGDEWYALWLEEPPKPKMQRQMPPRGSRPF